MANLILKKLVKKIFISIWLGLLIIPDAFASTTGSNLPVLTGPINVLESAISGPVLMSIAIIMIVITCVMLAFGEWGEGFKKIINIVLWLSVAFAATSFVTSMFGSGAVF